MRNMETTINKYLEGYLKHYYSNGMSTTYAFEKESMGQYHIIILCKNSKCIICTLDTEGVIEELEDEPVTTKWNISHYFIITKEDKTKERFRYYLRTNCTAYVRMGRKITTEQTVQIAKEQLEKETLKKESVQAHTKIIGKLVENMEKNIRKDIEYIYLKRVYDMVKEMPLKRNEELEKNKKLRENLIRDVLFIRHKR